MNNSTIDANLKVNGSITSSDGLVTTGNIIVGNKDNKNKGITFYCDETKIKINYDDTTQKGTDLVGAITQQSLSDTGINTSYPASVKAVNDGIAANYTQVTEDIKKVSKRNFKFKGSVDTYDELTKKSSNDINDVWSVTNDTDKTKIGTYVWYNTKGEESSTEDCEWGRFATGEFDFDTTIKNKFGSTGSDSNHPVYFDEKGYPIKCTDTLSVNITGSSTSASLAGTANKVQNPLTIQISGSSDITYDGSEAKTIVIDSVPIGMVLPYACDSSPSGKWLYCDGREVSKSDYLSLYKVIGDIWTSILYNVYKLTTSSGYFRIPRLNDVNLFIQGGNNVSYKAAGIPNITGELGYGENGQTPSGCFYKDKDKAGAWGSASSDWDNPHIYFNASKSTSSGASDVYGKSSTVQPPAFTMRYYIKY